MFASSSLWNPSREAHVEQVITHHAMDDSRTPGMQVQYSAYLRREPEAAHIPCARRQIDYGR